MLYEFHVIILFMYSTIGVIVLSSVPLYYDRLALTDKEKANDEKKKKKKARQ